MSPGRLGSAIEEFDSVRFGGPTQEREYPATVTSLVTRPIGDNPDRVELIITNNGPDQVTWSTSAFQTAGTRHLIGVGQTLVFHVSLDGVLCGRNLYMAVPVNATAINVTEVTRARRGR